MRHGLMKKLGVVAAIAAAGVSLAACGSSKSSSSSSSSKTTTITFWNGFTSTDGDVLKQIVKDYNKTNKDHVKVKMDIMTWDNFNQKLPTGITAKKAPDFVAMNYGDMASYVANGTMKDMGDFYKQSGVDKSNFETTARNLGVINGKTYFVPMQVQGMYLYWNKKLFKKAGLNPNNPPKTWAELATDAKKISKLGNNTQGFAMPKDGSAIMYNLLQDNGAKLLNGSEKKSALNSAATKKSFDYLQQLIYKDGVGPKNISGAEADNLMLAGSLGLYINGPWLNSGLKKNNIDYGMSTLVQAKQGDKKAILDGVGFGIPTSTSDSKTKAIYSFVKYWNTTKIGKKWSLENKCAPYLKSVAANKDIKADKLVSTMYKQIGYAKPYYPGNKNMSNITTNVINPSIEKVLAGSNTTSTMKSASKQIDSTLSGN
ncbi:ABC transporter substrate-binding protein [Levilactobacillus fujinensis]|uniref:ABC transporter substrate-binding protein n=1 Tax=Levilactobacillus fujinensis TaxID=2486024 RepID=A0ABW1TE60_9LACO|nr:ABC transporter substrate-binding protein [Levilactobacillus fujinensis]